MGMRRNATERVVLRRCWRRWVVVIEFSARRRRGSRLMDPQAHDALHKELIATCRSLRVSAEGSERAFYQGWEERARPWLSPSVLAKSDREILLDLLLRCRQAERALGRETWASAAWRWSLPVVVSSMVAAAVFLLIGTAGGRWSAVLDWGHGWSALVWLALNRAGALPLLCVVGPIVAWAWASMVVRAVRD
jgi:hypothetical protein